MAADLEEDPGRLEARVTFREPFGHWLRRVREAAGVTLVELATAAGVTAQHVSAVELGRAWPPPPAGRGCNWRAWAPLLGVTEAAIERRLLDGRRPLMTGEETYGQVSA